MVRQQRLIVVLGPTAAGKSSLAVRLAQMLQGEVISADSQQVYRYFNIGTGKISREDQQGIPHHLIDVVNPEQPFSAARFVQLADQSIEEISQRGKRIVVAGGTGLYVRALLHGLFEAPLPDADIRQAHRTIWETEGSQVLRERLQAVDPAAAARIQENDFVRISRALEVFQQTGRPISEMHREHQFQEGRYEADLIGVMPDRVLLRQRIDQRVDQMMEAGWLDEVRQLIDAGFEGCRPMGALGYKQLHSYLRGELDLLEAVRQTKRDTWRFARRQLNWFSSETEVRWLADADVDAAALQNMLADKMEHLGDIPWK